MKDFEYYSPLSLDEALLLLQKLPGDVMVLAGGTDLIVRMKYERALPDALLDVKKIPDLNRLEWDDTHGLFVGAAVPVARVAAFAPVAVRYGFLRDACSLIGSFQLRSRATLGGNICNAAPSADSAPPLLCLEPRVIIAGPSGRRAVSLPQFFVGPGKTALAERELLVGLELPAPPAYSTGCYMRHIPRQDMDVAVVGVASLVVFEQQGRRCLEARIALGAVAPTPIRATDAESFLTGRTLEPDVLEEAATLAAGTARPISDGRGSVDYRREIVKVLTTRTLEAAMRAFESRAGG